MSDETDSKNHEARIIQSKQGIWRTYDGTDGLSPAVFCLLQDRQGYLWLGTMHGLCSYDGVRFITYTTEDGLPANHVDSICEDSQGRLWFGTWDSGVSCAVYPERSRRDGERFINYTTEDGLAGSRIMSICEDSQGRLWFGTNGGVLVDGQISRLSIDKTISQGENPPHNSTSIHTTSKKLTISSQNSPRVNPYTVLRADMGTARVYNLCQLS